MRPLADAERSAVERGTRSADTYTLHRSQILAASAQDFWYQTRLT